MTIIKTEPLTGKRISATIIDYVIIFGFLFAYVMTFGSPNEEGGKTVSGWPALVPVIFWFAWLIIAEAVWGCTLGHYLSGIKVVSLEGEKPTFIQAFQRRICDAFEISWCFGLIAFILVKNTQYHQRLGDIWAKTLVIDRDATLERHDFEFEKSDVK